MPTLPDPSRIQRRTPRGGQGVQAPRAATAGAGLQQLAGVASDFGKEFARQTEVEEARKDKLELSKARAEWKKSRAEQSGAYDQDEDFKTIEGRYRNTLTERSGEISAAISNPDNRQLFEDSISGDIDIGATQMRRLAFGKESDFELSRLDEDLADLRGIALASNDDEAIQIASERIDGAVDAGYLTQQQATNLRQGTTKDYAISRVQLADPMDRRRLLKGSLGQYIDADDQKKLLASASKEYSRGLDDYVSYLSAGNEPDPDLEKRFSRGNVNAFMGDQAGKINEALSDAKMFGRALNEVKTATPEELRSILEREAPNDPKSFKRESSQFNAIQKAIQHRNKQLSNDPALYVNENVPEVRESYDQFISAYQSGQGLEEATRDYAEAQREAQENLGISYSSVQLLPASVENQIATQLNDFSQGGEQSALNIQSLKDSFGAEWPAVQRQLQSNKKVGGSIQVLSGMEFGPEMVSLAEAESVGQKGYKEVINPDIYKEIGEKSMALMEDFQDTVRGQPGGEKAYTIHRKSIETLAMKYIADGLYEDADDALEQANEDVIGKRFDLVGSYRVPKQYNSSLVEQNADTTIDDIKTGKFDLMIPDSARVKNSQDRKEVYLDVLQPSPITSPDGDGLLFIDQNGNAILKSNGDPLVVPWGDLQESPEQFGLLGEEL